MTRLLNNNKGFVFAVVILAIVFVIGLSAVFFTRSTSEKRFIDIEKYTMQASFLAEAAANHGLSELRERIRVDLAARTPSIPNVGTLNQYYVDGSVGYPLGLLIDYGYIQGDTAFTLIDDQAILDILPLNLQGNVDASYTCQIIITADPDYSTNQTNPSQNVYVFYYDYEISGTGYSTATTPNITKNTSLLGSFTVTVRLDDFAKYALFTNHHTSGPGNNPVWFNDTTSFYGPVHTNDEFSFANNPSGYFMYEVTQHQNRARYYNEGDPVLLDDVRNGDLDVPIFDRGFTRGAAQVNITSAVEENNLRAQALGTMSEPGAQGIYVPVDGSNNLTGGVYISGDVSSLVCSAAASGPQYVITQGAVTKTITVDYGANTTTVTEAGVPTV